MLSFGRWSKSGAHAWILALFMLFSIVAQGQDESANESVKTVPILTGATGYFTRVTGGQFQDAPSVSPLLLLPVGDKWLLEAKGNYSLTYAKGSEGYYESTSGYGLIYGQVDYLANRYLTIVGGRFTTPFGVYGERLAPNWIKDLQLTPLIYTVPSGSSLGGMLRGGFPAGSQKVDFNYAVYFSAANTNHIVATDRSTGGRIGFFFPEHRVEFGASFQQVLQLDRPHSAGLHFVWQPYVVPLTVRSEFVRQSGTKGSGYWIESEYRLSQVPYLRRLEPVARVQQFFADPKLTAAQIKKLGAFARDTNQADFGLNYYLRYDLRATASYGRQFILNRDSNLWVVGLTYRFLVPLGPTGLKGNTQ